MAAESFMMEHETIGLQANLRKRGSMNYSEIKYFDIANGEGVRTSLFVSGCRHGCPGCFNPDQWDFTA